MMTIGLIVLSKNDKYLTTSGELPSRPSWDKQFLLNMCTNQRILCSKKTLAILPKSITNIVKSITTDITQEYDINLGIDTFKAKPSLLIITRGTEIIEGKTFNLYKYIKILTQGGIEIWTLKN